MVCLLPPAVRARGVQCDAVSLGDCQRAAARGEDALGVEGLQIALAELGAPRTEFAFMYMLFVVGCHSCYVWTA